MKKLFGIIVGIILGMMLGLLFGGIYCAALKLCWCYVWSSK